MYNSLFRVVALASLVLSAAPPTFAASTCANSDIKTLHQQVKNVPAFCRYFLSRPRSRSPIPPFRAGKLTELCKCVLPKYRRLSGSPRQANGGRSKTCRRANLAILEAQFQSPRKFCSYFTSVDRSRDTVRAVPGLGNVAAVQSACACYSVVATTTAGTTKKTKTTKTTKTTKSSVSNAKGPSVISGIKASTNGHQVSSTSTHKTTTEPATPISATTNPTAPLAVVTAMSTGTPYVQYFAGEGRVQNLANRGNTDNPPRYTTFDGSLPLSVVLQLCIDTAYLQIGGRDYNPGTTFLSVDFHFVISNSSYVCVQWFNQNDDAGTFDVLDPNVGLSFGYSAPALN